MQLKPEEISKIIRAQIKHYENAIEQSETDVGIKEGSTVKRTGKVVSVPVGEAMIGRVVNALGQPIDGAGPIETTEFRAIESRAPGIIDRQPVKEPLQT